MKITRLRSGYRISLSDTDYEMLSGLVTDGIMSLEGDPMAQAHWKPAEKAAYTRRQKVHGDHGFMAVDESRR